MLGLLTFSIEKKKIFFFFVSFFLLYNKLQTESNFPSVLLINKSGYKIIMVADKAGYMRMYF